MRRINERSCSRLGNFVLELWQNLLLSNAWPYCKAFVFWCSIVLFLQDADAQSRPKIVVSNPVYAFGTVSQGETVKHEFSIKNAGTADLVIDKAIPSCGCTAALPPNGPIQPGKEGIITVSFDTSGFVGEKSKEVRLFSNDTESQAPVLTLKGYIETPFIAEPGRVNYGEVVYGDAVEPKEISVSVKDGSGYQIKSIESFTDIIKIEQIKGDGTKKSFLVSLGSKTPMGEVRDRVVITLRHTSGKEQSYNVPVIASVKSDVQLAPQVVSFGVISGNTDIKKNFRIANRSNRPISIESIVSDNPAVRAEVKPGKDKRDFMGVVSIDPSSVTSDVRAAVRIGLSGSQQKELVLNVFGIVPPKH